LTPNPVLSALDRFPEDFQIQRAAPSADTAAGAVP